MEIRKGKKIDVFQHKLLTNHCQSMLKKAELTSQEDIAAPDKQLIHPRFYEYFQVHV